MSFSGTTIIKTVTEETPDELSAWNFDIVIFAYECVRNLKIVCPGVSFCHRQGVIFSVPV